MDFYLIGRVLLLINGACLKNSIISGANNIAKNKAHIDELNIFPVPDGDTGTNMSMTILSAAESIKTSENDKIGEVAKAISSALLRGARGNSGVILSILFKGIAKGLENLNKASGSDLVSALGLGVDAAYKSVMKPTEGTMLTVARVAYERGKIAAHFNNSVQHVWAEVCRGARDALKTTPELLPVLKKAGVVDAGGKGLCLVFEGMLSVFKDGIIMERENLPLNIETDDTFRNSAAAFDDDIRFTYCTEFIAGKKINLNLEIQKLRKKLENIGDCVVVVDDEEIIKVHVHTENPGTVLQEGLKYGELLNVKIENMKEQHRKAAEAEKEKALKVREILTKAEPIGDVGFVAVASGSGVHALFKDLGCEHVISGGQTMNPSTDEILEAILATPSKTVFVLPNNKNIIMAANQTVDLVKDRKVIVVPSKTVPQGVSAMLSFDPEKPVQENLEAMTESMKNVSTGQVTFASRDSEFGGIKIKEGDILGLDNGKLVFTDKDHVALCERLVESMVTDKTEFITIIYGEKTKELEANALFANLRNKLRPEIDINLINGGQAIYYFTVSVE